MLLHLPYSYNKKLLMCLIDQSTKPLESSLKRIIYLKQRCWKHELLKHLFYLAWGHFEWCHVMPAECVNSSFVAYFSHFDSIYKSPNCKITVSAAPLYTINVVCSSTESAGFNQNHKLSDSLNHSATHGCPQTDLSSGRKQHDMWGRITWLAGMFI